MVNTLSNTINRILERLGRRENNLDFPPEYYERTDDLRVTLCKFEKAVELIKEKYEPFLLKIAQAEQDKSFFERKEIEDYKKKIEERIKDEVEYARLVALYRLGDVTKPGLEKLIRYARTYDPKMVEVFKKEFRILKGRDKLLYVKNLARGRIANDLMMDIRRNINPWGERAEKPFDWKKKLKLLNDGLAEKGLLLDDENHDERIKDIWYNVCKEMGGTFRVSLVVNTAEPKVKAKTMKKRPQERDCR